MLSVSVLKRERSACVSEDAVLIHNRFLRSAVDQERFQCDVRESVTRLQTEGDRGVRLLDQEEERIGGCRRRRGVRHNSGHKAGGKEGESEGKRKRQLHANAG